KFVFDAIDVGNEIWWRLVDPSGKDVFGSSGFSDLDNVEMPLTGTYTLLIEGRVSQNAGGRYAFRVAPVTVQSSALTIGERVDATVSAPGATHEYSFTLDSAKRLVFDSFSDLQFVNWSLRGPDGVVVTAREFRSSDGIDFSGNPVLDLRAGGYTLTVDGAGDFTGAYAFRLLDLASATEMAPGSNY